ncbi:MAG: cardiolipin synthase B [Verrucomicrobia bacterium]|nr:cardiolipin synthase B [Verrucomicrobiota bacterium]
MPLSLAWLDTRFWKLPLRSWLGLVLALFALGAVGGAFFLHRRIVQHRPEHTFGVRDPAFFGSAHALSDPVPVAGNKIELLQNGDAIFPAMLGALRAAKKTINFEAYIFFSDGTGRQFRDVLCERARAGLEVRVILDGIGSGSKLANSDVKMLRDAGCRFAYFHPVRSWRADRLDHRSHRRVCVIDGRLAFVGSAGFADPWSGHAQDQDHWRDLHARVEGPLVAKLQAAFQDHWMQCRGEVLSGPDQFPALPPAGALQAQTVSSHSFSVATVPLVQAQAIAAAERSICITNAYFTPTPDQVDLLLKAVQRQVEVRILLPGEHNDQPATKSAGRTAYGKLLEGGVKIYEYQPTMIHQKTLVVDGMFAMLGSSNLDSRSSQLNDELDVTVYDEAFGKQMEAVFENDLRSARLYTLEEFKKRGLWERFTEWLVIPFRSQL